MLQAQVVSMEIEQHFNLLTTKLNERKSTLLHEVHSLTQPKRVAIREKSDRIAAAIKEIETSIARTQQTFEDGQDVDVMLALGGHNRHCLLSR